MASLSCGYKCLQCMLLIFNVVVILCGIGLMIAGGIAEYNVATYLSKDVIELHAFVIFIIAFGFLLTVTGILGFAGTCVRNACFLTLVSGATDCYDLHST
ncbi:cd63 antigen-like [Clonorchis sinensis]|uniref:Cd63 antigen-like n=1 Tax=Clonorchis sinensis TaxID=79923 RepID=G7YB66_CLOSI|nr:cd63 antigen-like [Clonorchis sinensis]